jgi:peptidoglycan DL-endopeptidase CwlO
VATSRAARSSARTRALGVTGSTARHARPARFLRVVGVAVLATATTVAFLPAGAALADPRPSVNDLESRVQQLDTQASLAVEEFRQAEQQVVDVERRAATARDRAAADQARLVEARAAMSDVVAAAYRRGGSDRLAALVVDQDPQTFLDRASALDRIARSQADVLAGIETARSRASAQQVAAARELEALRDARQRLAERKSQVERTLQAQQTLLAGLQEQERRRAEAARAAAEAARAPAPAPPRASRSSRPTPPPPPAPTPAPAPAAQAAPAAAPDRGQTYNGPASGRARTAIDEGYRQLGKPYQYGGSGPGSFDCSGFTSWVWRAAGVSLPRTSRDQYAQGRKVARDDVQPGDLLYFGSPIHHVGMYVGDGQMINAPQSGGHVRIQAAFRSDYVGATRP